MAALSIAVAGAGLIGRAHIALIRKSERCTLAAIADPTPQAQAFANEIGVPHFADLERMLDAVKPQGVIVATPNAAHVANGLACVERGIPVLVEKPITETVESAKKLVAAAKQADVPLLVGHHRRHSAILAQARDVIRSGKLGRVTSVTAFTTFLKPDPYFEMTWRREPGGGPVLINLIHDIDDLRFLIGDIARVQAITSNAVRGFAVEDSAVVNLQFENGALGSITCSDAAAAPWSWELTSGENPAFPRNRDDCYFISGSAGSLAVPTMRLWTYGAERGWNAPLQLTQLAQDEADPLARQLDHFCAVIRREVQPACSGDDGAKTLAATLAIHESAASKRDVAPDR
jgi:predicted dehydrogenase